MHLDQALVDYAAALAAGNDQEADHILATVDAEDEARKARLTAPDALHNAARWYAAQGIACFPLKPGAKIPATRNGFKNATTDPQQIHAWWTTNPDYNIGLPTGIAFDVIDVDGPTGYASFATLRDGLPAELARAMTPRGLHLYVPPRDGAGNKAGLYPGIDYRAAGGYVVAPPSRIADRVYTWINPPTGLGAA